MHFVKKVKYISGYELQLTFEDGSVKFVDLEPHLDGAIFAPLKNVEYFKKVQLNQDIDTIVWENGADLSPDFLYKIAEQAREISEGE